MKNSIDEKLKEIERKLKLAEVTYTYNAIHQIVLSMQELVEIIKQIKEK